MDGFLRSEKGRNGRRHTRCIRSIVSHRVSTSLEIPCCMYPPMTYDSAIAQQVSRSTHFGSSFRGHADSPKPRYGRREGQEWKPWNGNMEAADRDRAKDRRELGMSMGISQRREETFPRQQVGFFSVCSFFAFSDNRTKGCLVKDQTG